MKNFCCAILLSLIALQVQSQTTVSIKASYDAPIGYHDGYPSHANTNWGTVTTNSAFTVPGYSTGLNKNRSLIWFDLSVIPAGAVVTQALINLYAHGPHGSLAGHTGTNNSAILQRVTQPWDDTTVTWNNQPTSTTINQVLLPSSTSAMQDYTNFTVTQLINDILDTVNFGIMFRLVSETPTNALLFSSVDHTDTTKHPVLEITYSFPGGPCPSYSFEKIIICEGDSAFIQGGYKKTSGYYFDTLVNVLNYDSIIVTYLHVNKPVNIIQEHTICEGDSIWIAGAYRKNPGVFPEVFSGAGGCDSTMLNSLVVITIDTSITVTGVTLTSNQQGATYQWIDCELGFNPIPGAVSQSFTPTMNGSYAVIITKDGCTAISPCIRIGNITVPEIEKSNTIRLVPNPTNGIIQVITNRESIATNIIVYNLKGMEVLRLEHFNGKEISVNLSGLSKGVYLVKVILDDGFTAVEKIVIESALY